MPNLNMLGHTKPNPYIIPPFKHMVLIKSNDWYYKPHSMPSCGVGGSCNRALLNRKKRRT